MHRLALARTIGFTGLRFSEATALKWSDIDRDKTLIRVERSNWRGIVTDTKTHKDRTVPVVPELAEVLREHRRAQVALQPPGLSSGWLFSTKYGEVHKGPALVQVLRRVLPKAEIDIRLTPHGLRRTFNDLSRQAARGIVVRGIMGHTTEAMTEHSSFVSPQEKLAASANVLRLVKEASTKRLPPHAAPAEKGEQGEQAEKQDAGSC